MQKLTHSVRLALSAMEAEATHATVAEYHAQPIAEAKLSVATSSPLSIVAAVHELVRAGLPLLLDLRDISRGPGGRS